MRAQRPGDNFVIAGLLRCGPARYQDLRAGMIKRNQKTPIPPQNFRRVVAQAEFMIMNEPDGLKSDRAERDDYRRSHEFNCPRKKVRTVSDFGRTWAPVRA